MQKLACFVLFLLFGGAEALEAKPRKNCRVVKPKAHRVGEYTAGKLSGRNLGGLYAAYTGVSGRIPSSIVVDPARQLDSMWRVKISCYKTEPWVQALHREFVRSYRASNRNNMTLGEFVAVAERSARSVRRDMDWAKLGDLYGLSKEERALVKKLSLEITGRDLVAYGLTELMPGKDGELNLQVLEFLVRNYGTEFLYAIPAMGDKYVSFGFFQFTSFAVYDDGKRLEGASKVSLALVQNRLPKSVVYLRDSVQFRAAYLFAIHNITTLVKSLDGKQIKRLSKLSVRNHDDLIQFIAAAHNGPYHARLAARRWINNRMKADFHVSVSNRLVRQYAQKTKANLLALGAHKSLDGILYGFR